MWNGWNLCHFSQALARDCQRGCPPKFRQHCLVVLMPSSCSACLTTPSPGSWPPGSLCSLLLLHLLPSNSLSPSHLLSIQGSHPLQSSPLDFIAFSPEPLHFLQVHESLQSLFPFPSASHHTLHHFIHSLQPLLLATLLLYFSNTSAHQHTQMLP